MNLTITPFELAFKGPLRIGPTQSIAATSRAWIHFEYQGKRLKGELPTLPGFLPLDLEAARAKLREVHPKNDSELDLTRPYFNLFQGPADSQLLFAFESALLPALNLKRKCRLLPSRPLLVALESEIPKGEGALKIKIARGDLKAELQYVNKVCQENPHASIRLDPNSLLEVQEITLLNEFAQAHPVVSLEVSSHEFRARNYGGLPLFYDDHLDQLTPQELAKFMGIVFKPTRDGGLGTFFKHSQNLRIEMSSTYESAPTLEVMKEACAIAGLPGPHGLATASLLKNP